MEIRKTERLLDQFTRGEEQKIKERKEREKKGRKKGNERRKKRKRKKKKRRGRKPNQRRAVVGLGQARNETILREVGVFLPRFYSTPKGLVMVYGFHLVSRRICMFCGLFVIVGRSWTKYMSS